MTLSHSPVSASKPPFLTPRIDDHEYKLVTLDNGIKALCVRDKKADKAAAAMDVSLRAQLGLIRAVLGWAGRRRGQGRPQRAAGMCPSAGRCRRAAGRSGSVAVREDRPLRGMLVPWTQGSNLQPSQNHQHHHKQSRSLPSLQPHAPPPPPAARRPPLLMHAMKSSPPAHSSAAAPGTLPPASAGQVRVGSMSDPADVAGLAHFTEHMLFYSSEKYPEEGEYRCGHVGGRSMVWGVGCRVLLHGWRLRWAGPAAAAHGNCQS